MSDLLATIQDVCTHVDSSAGILNELDARAGDGDMGVTMRAAAAAVNELLPDLEGRKPDDVLRECGAAIARKAPSTAGTLIAIGLLRAGTAVAGDADAGSRLATSLDAAAAGIAERGGADVGEKTILDALVPAAAAARREGVLASALESAAVAADMGAHATKTMVPRHGRAGWLAERSMGHEDPGARLVAIILRAAADAVVAGSVVGDTTPPPAQRSDHRPRGGQGAGRDLPL